MSVQNGRAFNEWLRTQLKAKKMSQRQLAQQSGVDHSTISRLVRGDRTPSLGTATKLARGLRELRDETETPHYFGLVQSSTSHPTARVEYALRSDDLLIVVSGYGMEPLGFGKRLIERVIGDPEISGTHEAAPDGFLLAYGASVDRGGQQARASVVDVTPTILYFLGLPLGRDMDGCARTDLFQRSFTAERPIAFIPTYDR